MDMDSAIRELVREMREMVAEEVRAQAAEAAQPPASVPPPGPGSSSALSARRPNGKHLVPHAPGDPTQPNFDAAEAAWFLRYPTMKAFYQAVRRYGIPHSRRGQRVMIFRRVELEKFLASRSRFR